MLPQIKEQFYAQGFSSLNGFSIRVIKATLKKFVLTPG